MYLSKIHLLIFGVQLHDTEVFEHLLARGKYSLQFGSGCEFK